ncbi:hypothetical protein F4604DRAFT_1794678 [Suillus subluteus]|nr:hypothetical protein F4604DRAFT_1794678 [Suillus subluteus]
MKAVLTKTGQQFDAEYRISPTSSVACIQLGLSHPPSPPQVMWNLDMCRKIYSRARSSEQNDRHPSAALRKVQCFRFAADADQSRWEPADPTWLWQRQTSWRSHSYSSEDFDWLVACLSNVYSNDHKTVGDIVFLLGSMRVGCSSAKQHLFIESLIACMDSSMPPRLRHAAHSSRETLATIDAVSDVDIVLTKFS